MSPRKFCRLLMHTMDLDDNIHQMYKHKVTTYMKTTPPPKKSKKEKKEKDTNQQTC